MSYLFRWVRQQQTLASRASVFLSNNNICGSSCIHTALPTVRPLYQVARVQPISTTTTSNTMSNNNQANGPGTRKANGNHEKESKSKHDDGIEYVIDFKRGLKVKDVIKQVYSLYGPVFVVCHIMFIPEIVMTTISDGLLESAQTGGKFVIAYAIHKLLLPVRLFASIFATRYVSRFIKAWKTKK